MSVMCFELVPLFCSGPKKKKKKSKCSFRVTLDIQYFYVKKISQSSCRAFIFHISHSAPLCPYYYSAFKFFRLTFGNCPVPANTHTLLDQCSFELINICGMIQNEQDNSDWVQTLSSPAEIDHTLAGRCRGTEQILYVIFTQSYIRHKS